MYLHERVEKDSTKRSENHGSDSSPTHRDPRRHRTLALEVVAHRDDGGKVHEPEAEPCNEQTQEIYWKIVESFWKKHVLDKCHKALRLKLHNINQIINYLL